MESLHRIAISVKRAVDIPRGLRNPEEWAMLSRAGRLALAGLAATISACATLAYAGGDEEAPYDAQAEGQPYNARNDGDESRGRRSHGIQVGVRPYYLVQGMDPGKLKDKLLSCQDGPFYRTDFSIGHRGAALEFPEHTKESYEAGAREGAGIVECDVTFTKDGALVCRHDECDLHTTTNIVNTPLNAACTVPWSGPNSAPKCCASDVTLSQFKSLRGKMDSSVPSATTAARRRRPPAIWAARRAGARTSTRAAARS
jgi:glycerophosphoryl diester phosphodiesterase